MARIKIPRKIANPPRIKGFKPFGHSQAGSPLEPVTLHFEEYEAFVMCDYDMYNHRQAAMLMNISRPTFTRIYASARVKLAKAFAEGRQIEIEGGKVYFDSDWYLCNSCGCHFNNPQKDKPTTNCPLCGANQIERHTGDSPTEGPQPTDENLCICPGCGFTRRHRHGVPCRHEVCPSCNTHLTRKTP